MIIEEIVTINNRKLRHIYSSSNKYIQQVETNTIYSEAYDTLKSNYHYIETEKELEENDILENEEKGITQTSNQ